MAVPTGTASLANIQTEFGGSNPISLSEYYGIASNPSGVPASGAISINNFRGKAKLTPFRYLRWRITNNGGEPYCQAAEFVLMQGGTIVNYSSLCTASNPGYSNAGGTGPTSVMDGNNSTKWFTWQPTPTLIFDFGVTNILRTFTQYRYTTANDFPGRYPRQWYVEASVNNSTWSQVHFRAYAGITGTRFANAGTWALTWPP